MRKMFCYLFFVFILSFVFVNEVSAECSYQERKALLNEAKGVDINFEVLENTKEISGINPNTEEEEKYETTVYSFKMNIIGMTNNMFIKISNNLDSSQKIVNYEDMQDGVYSFEIDNVNDIIKYYVEFFSTNNNCYAESITTKTVKKPKENPVYYYSVCSNEIVEDSDYCKHFIDKEFSKNIYDIVKDLNDKVKVEEQKSSDVSDKKGILNFVRVHWYLFIIIVVIGIGIGTVVLVRKKRSRL